MEPGVHLSAKTAPMHLPRKAARIPDHQARDHRRRGGNGIQPALEKRATAGMAKSGVGLRGRTLVALLLAAFVVVALSIVWRRTLGIGQAERLAVLDARKG